MQTLGNVHIRWRQAQNILDVICRVLILQHPSDLAKVFICKKTIDIFDGIVFLHLLLWVTVASSAASAILNLSEGKWMLWNPVAYTVQMNLNNKKMKCKTSSRLALINN